jgi:hypothetical protein
MTVQAQLHSLPLGMQAAGPGPRNGLPMKTSRREVS